MYKCTRLLISKAIFIHLLLLLEVDKVPEDSSELSQVLFSELTLLSPVISPPLLQTSQLVREVRRNDRKPNAI